MFALVRVQAVCFPLLRLCIRLSVQGASRANVACDAFLEVHMACISLCGLSLECYARLHNSAMRNTDHKVLNALAVGLAATDRDTGRSRGFGHIQFASVEAAAAAIAMSGQSLAGRDLFIDSAQERTPAAGGAAGDEAASA